MSNNNRTKGNDALRWRLKSFLKCIPSGEEIKTNSLVMKFSKLNKNYSISSARITNLLKEQENLVKFVKSGIWMKI